MTSTDFPALDGQPVTEHHVRLCATNGHARHTTDGVDDGVCPRCGEVTPSAFVSYMSDMVEHVHAADCSRAKRDARRAGVPLYPALGNVRGVLIDSFADVWSDEFASTDEAITAGVLTDYADYCQPAPCALSAGFVNTLDAVEA